MPPIEDHPLRYPLTNELHARPFPSLEAPCTAVFLAFKEPVDAANRDRAQGPGASAGAAGPQRQPPSAARGHAFLGPHRRARAEMGKPYRVRDLFRLFARASARCPSTRRRCGCFPRTGWRRPRASGWSRFWSGSRRCRRTKTQILAKLEDWFVPESLACSRVVDGAAIVAGDFRIDPAGNMRFAVFVKPGHRRAADRPDRAAAVRDRDLPRHVDAGPDAGARPCRAG